MSLYQMHIFVCLNERPEDDPRGSCGQKGSKLFHKKLKEEIKAKNLPVKIRVNRAGCLDTCNHGISMVIYPQGIWYGRVAVEDIPEIIGKTVLNGEIIERLQMPFMRPSKAAKVIEVPLK